MSDNDNTGISRSTSITANISTPWSSYNRSVEVSSLFVFRELVIIPRNYLFRIHPLFSHSLSPYPPPSHSSAPFSFNFPPFVRYPISSQYPQSYSISMQMADNGACVSPFDPCPVIIQYVRVTRDVITGFCRSSLSHCWRFTIELENRGNRRSTCTMYTHVFSFILFFHRWNVIVRNILRYGFFLNWRN